MNGRILHRLLNRYILSEQVRNIILPRRFATNAVLRKIGKQCPNLEDLTLTNVSLTPKLNVNELPNSLRQISFIKCKVGKRSLYRSDLGVSLNFRTVRFLEYTCSYELGSCLRLLKNVQGLVISNCDCYSHTLSMRLLSEQNPDLTSISLCNLTGVTDSVVEAMSQSIPNLTSLTLRGNVNLTESCFEHIKKMKKLKSIDVSDNPQFDNETLDKFILEHSKSNR